MNSIQSEVAIVILNYKRYQDTIDCIESFYSSIKNPNCLFIIVDNASKNDSLKKIHKHFKALKARFWDLNNKESSIGNIDMLFVQNSENTGYASGNNVGLRIGFELGFKYLMVLNNDIIFIDDCLDKLKLCLDADSSVLGVGPLLLKCDRSSIDYNCAKRRPTYLDIFRLSYFGRWLQTNKWAKEYYYLKKDPNLDKSREVDIISGSCMFFNAKNLKNIDFFDENTFLYYEEAILHEKARRKNYKFILEPNMKIIHLGAQTTKNEIISSFILNCEYNSLKIYLREYRNMTKFYSNILLISNMVFIIAYKTKEIITSQIKNIKTTYINF
jgi:GT2 family glycosyltransferase